MTESDLQRLIMIEASKTGARLFRNNVAEGWIGASSGPFQRDGTIYVRAGSVVIADARRLHAGLCKGSSDLIGWAKSGQFVALEIKSAKGRPTEEQRSFIKAVDLAGGIGIIARSVEDVLEVLK